MKRLSTLGLTLSLLTGSVSAELIEQDWLNNGDSLITYDSSSQLQWLDLTQTRGWSINTAIQVLETNDLYRGWRMPDRNEVKNLFEQVLFPGFTFDAASFPDNVHYGTGTREQGLLMTSLFGNTAPQYEAVSYGIAAIGPDAGEFHGSFVSGSDNRLYHNDLDVDYNYSYSQAGVFLVRDASVPEPAPALLLGLSMTAFFFLRRRQSR